MSTPHTTTWAGIDVSKMSFDAAIATPLALAFDADVISKLPARKFERTPEGAAAFLAWARERAEETGTTLRAVMEATGAYSIELAAWLGELDPQLLPAIANPKRTCDFIKSLGLRNKTDKLEARALALYGLQRSPAPYEQLTPERAQLRSLLRYRDALVEQYTAERLRAEEPCACATVRKLQKRRLEQFKRDIAKLEEQMHKLIASVSQLHCDLKRLTTIYGVGFLTAAVILAEVGDLRRFRRARQLSAFAGLNPTLKHSGTSRHTSNLCKQGNGRVRKALYMAATTAIRGDNELAHYYQTLRAKAKVHKAALAAIMRKLLIIMRALIITQNDYRAHPKTSGKLPAKVA